MEELIKKVSEKTGLSEDLSRQVTEAVLDTIKEKLPGPIASQIDTVLSGGDLSESLGDMAKGLGSILGKK